MPSTTCTPASRTPDLARPDGTGAEPDLAGLRERIGYEFVEPALLRRALSHRSWCAEVSGQPSNERLEFLGDAVLGWVIADIAYRRHQDLPEGKLTDVRKSVVNATALAQVAREVDLGPCLLLGKGEDAAGGRDKASILSDALEAVIGAVYLDGGVIAAAELIERLFADALKRATAQLGQTDFKTMLQETAARVFDTAPAYVLRESGPDHAKTFVATVLVGDRNLGEGTGRSKKVAEQAAAAQALELLTASGALDRGSTDVGLGDGF